MAAKKISSSSAKSSPKGEKKYTHLGVMSAAQEPALSLIGAGRSVELATLRALEVLKPYAVFLRSPMSRLAAIKRGLEAKAINDLIEITGATQLDLAHILDLTEPTLRKHIKAGKQLNTVLSEHILLLFELFDKGMDTFGSLTEFKNWLRHESIVFSAKPIEMLDTITGIHMVMDELIRIDHGITA